MLRKLYSVLLVGIACLFAVPQASAQAKPGSTDSEGYPIFYLRGNITGWGVDDNYRFTRSGSDFSLHLATLTEGFKVSDDNWGAATNFGANSDDREVTGSCVKTTKIDGENFQVPDGLTLSDVTLKFTYTKNQQTGPNLTIQVGDDVVIPEPEPTPDPGNYPVIYLRGANFPGGWETVDASCRFSRTGSTYTLHVDQLSGQFKFATEDWKTVDLGADADKGQNSPETLVTGSCSKKSRIGGDNFNATSTLNDVTISFNYSEGSAPIITFSVNGEVVVPGVSGTLPILFINVYNEDGVTYNNEIIDKDLSHKNYFNGYYWLDTNGCDWLIAEGAENLGSREKPLELEIKARGNYTRTGFSKKPFKLKLGKKQSMLGMTKSKHYAILAHADDNKGYLRNFTGFNLGKRMELPWTPEQQPVEVVINGDYRGLYFLTESIRVGDDRIMIEELDDEATDPALISGGYVVELDNYDEDDNAQIRMDEKVNVWGHYVDKLRVTFDTPEVYSPIQRRFISDQFSEMNNLVGANSDALWSYIDMDDLARYYLVEEIISHVESFHGSTYMFRDRGEGQKWHFSPLWDCGNGFNGSTGDFFYDVDPFGNTWIPSIRNNNKFNNKVRETWMWFMSNKYDGLISDIDTYVAHISEAAKADHARWKDAPLPDSGNRTPVYNNSDMSGRRNEVVDHLNSKIKWLKDQFGDYTVRVTPEPARDNTAAAPLPSYAVADIVNIAVDDEDKDAPIEYYNLQGVRLNGPTPGELYIIKKGKTAIKAY